MRSLASSPSAWASAATRSTPSYHLPQSTSISTHNNHVYTHHLQSFNSHHDRSYTHHLTRNQPHGPDRPAVMRTKLSSPSPNPRPSPSGAGGRRRSTSIRMPPASYIKFDPFADEPIIPAAAPSPPLSVTTPLTSSSQANRSAAYHSLHNTPYTIQIPPAAPTEIQRYAPSASARRLAFPSSSTGLGNGATFAINGGGRIGSGSASAPVSRASSPAPAPAAAPKPAQTPRQASGPGALGGPNVSKLVAGILLNRVHAVGKPMRRRVPSFGDKREYVKSCLSSVVSVEA